MQRAIPVNANDESLEDGLYRANFALTHYNYNQVSMSNGYFTDHAGYLEVNGDSRKLYFALDEDVLGSFNTLNATLSISNPGKVAAEYRSYFTYEGGSVTDSSGVICPKHYAITLEVDRRIANGYYPVSMVIYPMGGQEMPSRLGIASLTKLADGTVNPYGAYDKSLIRYGLLEAEATLKNLSGTPHTNLSAAIDDAKAVYDAAGGETPPTSDEIKAAVDALALAVKNAKQGIDATVNKTALQAKIAEAKGILKGDKTNTAFDALQDAIAIAEAVNSASGKTQAQINAAVTALNDAINAFKSSETATKLDKDNLADGNYAVRIAMRNAFDPKQPSMAHGAVEHWVNLTVSGGAYYVTLDFKGLEIALGGSSFFGYLKELSYYTNGDTPITGAYAPAQVLSTQKDAQNNDVIDSYNEGKGFLYPDLVRFPLVKKAAYDDDLVPLHVFVPIMDTFDAGDQDVCMRVDWGSLKSGTVEENDLLGGGSDDDDTYKDEDDKYEVADRTALSVKITEAAAIAQGNKYPAAYATLQSVIEAVRAVLGKANATQSEIDSALAALNAAIATFNSSADVERKIETELEQSTLPEDDGDDEDVATDLADLEISAADKVWTGKKIATGFILTADGEKLSASKDYSITSTGANKNIGVGTVKITGKGNYTGTATVKFKIVPKAVKVKSVKVGKKSLTVKWT
jgi:hypothetical protein